MGRHFTPNGKWSRNLFHGINKWEVTLHLMENGPEMFSMELNKWDAALHLMENGSEMLSMEL